MYFQNQNARKYKITKDVHIFMEENYKPLLESI